MNQFITLWLWQTLARAVPEDLQTLFQQTEIRVIHFHPKNVPTVIVWKYKRVYSATLR